MRESFIPLTASQQMYIHEWIWYRIGIYDCVYASHSNRISTHGTYIVQHIRFRKLFYFFVGCRYTFIVELSLEKNIRKGKYCRALEWINAKSHNDIRVYIVLSNSALGDFNFSRIAARILMSANEECLIWK